MTTSWMDTWHTASRMNTWHSTAKDLSSPSFSKTRTLHSSSHGRKSTKFVVSCQDTKEICRRHAIVTGGNSGIGKALAKALALKGMAVTLACRRMAEGSFAASEISEATGNPHVRASFCDLSSLESVRKFSEDYKKKNLPLHVLALNAGVMACPKLRTEDGFELQFGVNHIGHFELTRKLFSSLLSSSDASQISRVVVTTSAAEILGKIDFDDLNFEKSRYYFRWNAYAQSKLANSLFSFELARRCEAQGAPISVNCYHPGIVDTELIRHVLPAGILERRQKTPNNSARFARFIGLKTVEEGAQTGLYLASSPEMEGKSGGYYVDSKKTKPSSNSRDLVLAKKLWEASEDLVGYRFQVGGEMKVRM